MPTPAAIAAAAATRFRFMVRVPPQTVTTLVTSCLAGYAGTTRRRLVTVLPLRIVVNGNPIRELRLLRAAKDTDFRESIRLQADQPCNALSVVPPMSASEAP
jgi:hypothetical protein